MYIKILEITEIVNIRLTSVEPLNLLHPDEELSQFVSCRIRRVHVPQSLTYLRMHCNSRLAGAQWIPGLNVLFLYFIHIFVHTSIRLALISYKKPIITPFVPHPESKIKPTRLIAASRHAVWGVKYINCSRNIYIIVYFFIRRIFILI